MVNHNGDTFCDICTGTCQGMCNGFFPAGMKASMESLKRHQQQVAETNNQLSRRKHLDCDPFCKECQQWLSEIESALYPVSLKEIYVAMSARAKSQKRELHKISHRRCWYCGNQCRKPTVDHQLPVSRGGDNQSSNLVTACKQCNGEKGDMTVEEYRATGAAQFNGLFYGEFTKEIDPSILKYQLREVMKSKEKKEQ